MGIVPAMKPEDGSRAARSDSPPARGDSQTAGIGRRPAGGSQVPRAGHCRTTSASARSHRSSARLPCLKDPWDSDEWLMHDELAAKHNSQYEEREDGAHPVDPFRHACYN